MLYIHPSDLSRDRIASDTSDASFLSYQVTPQTILLDSSISPPGTPLTPTLGHNPRVGANTQTGTKEPVKVKLPVEPPESPTKPTYSPVQEQKRPGGAPRTIRRSSPIYSLLKEDKVQSGLDKSFKRKAAEQRESSHLSSSVKKEEDSKKRTKREAPKETSKEAPPRKEPANPRKTS